MAVKLFVIGPPGSGKSTVCRYLDAYIKQRHGDWAVSHINDYVYLREIFLSLTEPDHFYATPHGGFIVREPEIYDRALQTVEQQVLSAPAQEQKELLLIEFARSDYRQAFKQFAPHFVADASFLYLQVDIVTGVRRIQERINHPNSEDDYFVPPETFERYRAGNSWQYIADGLRKDYSIDGKNIKVVDNAGRFGDIKDKIKRFVDLILERKDAEIVSARL